MTLRLCVVCGVEKTPDQFHRSRSGRDGLNRCCKPCQNGRNAASSAKRVGQDRTCARCKIFKEGTEFSSGGSYCRACRKIEYQLAPRRDDYVWRKFSLRLEDWHAMRWLQDNRCAICETSFGNQTPHVDHDHKCCTGAGRSCGKCTRGLVCIKCNLMLGNANEEPNRLLAAIRYLTAWTG